MSVYVPLQNAMEQSRFKEVVSIVISTFENEPLNSAEIIRLGEIALQAIERDHSNKKYKQQILKRLASAYISSEKYAHAKQTYIELIECNDSWENVCGLLQALEKIGEIEEIKIQILALMPQLIRERKTPQLKKLYEILNQLGALSSLKNEIDFYVRSFEGDISRIMESPVCESLFLEETIKNVSWEKSGLYAGKVAEIALEFPENLKREIIKKIYDAFMLHGPKDELVLALLKYFKVYHSQHIGYFFNQNPGVRVELPPDQWIDEVFKDTLSLKKPSEIEFELDLGEDLFAPKASSEESPFKKIKGLETKISFLLKNGARDEARKSHISLMELDPSNKKFEKEFKSDLQAKNNAQESEHWTFAWETLKEIEGYARKSKPSDTEVKVSWKNIEDSDLVENFIEYSYALIHSSNEEACIELLEKVIVLESNAFKEASYLKARCCLSLGRNLEARAIAESIVESCLLENYELIELNYLCAESYEAQGKLSDALAIYKKVFAQDPKYRLVGMKISNLEMR